MYKTPILLPLLPSPPLHVKGAFTLEFVGLDPGMAIKIEASKQGLEIVNTRDLDEVIIGRKLPYGSM